MSYARTISRYQKTNVVTLDILNELQICLSFEKGGQIAQNLDAIYSFITRRLLEGDVKNDLTAYDESIRVLGELKQGWDGIAPKNMDPQSTPNPHPPLKPRFESVAA